MKKCENDEMNGFVGWKVKDFHEKKHHLEISVMKSEKMNRQSSRQLQFE